MAVPTSYAIRDVGKPGVPMLTSEQRRAISEITKRTSSAVQQRLRFAITGYEGKLRNMLILVAPGRAKRDGTVPGKSKPAT
jgi:hypothetical protein